MLCRKHTNRSTPRWRNLDSTSLAISTKALESNDPRDSTYNSLESQLMKFTARRNTLANKIRHALENATFKNKPLDDAVANDLINQANVLLTDVHNLASN